MGKIFGYTIGTALVVCLIVFALALGPLLSIWALNVLSEQAKWGWQIPHNLYTYFAWLLLFFVNFGLRFTSASSKK